MIPYFADQTYLRLWSIANRVPLRFMRDRIPRPAITNLIALIRGLR